MLRAIRKPFGYEPILSKEDIKGTAKRKGSVQETGNRFFTEFGYLSMNNVRFLLRFLRLFSSVPLLHC